MGEIQMGNEGDKNRLRNAVHAVEALSGTEPRQLGVLVVERDPDLQWRLARSLTVQGHRVVGTSSGEGAMALVAQWPVDLVLIDEELPGISGIEVAGLIQRAHPDIPVVLITSAGPQQRFSLIPGVVGWLTKPFATEALEELLERIQFGASLAEPAE